MSQVINPSRYDIIDEIKVVTPKQKKNPYPAIYSHGVVDTDNSEILSEDEGEDKKRNCCESLLSLVCCHCLGNTCCRKGTKSRKCGKKFFKTMSVGQINNGLYFSRSQQYLSAVSGIFTLLGAIVIIVLSTKVFIDIYYQTTI